MTAINQALGAYATAATNLAGGASPAAKPAGGSDFAAMLQSGALNALGEARQAENLSGKALQSKADIADVVNAVTNAETTLMTVISLRDRMVGSLQEIMRMPV